jgi:hypothetical protein
MVATRDPLSEWFDPAARRLITRAYGRRGEWTGVFLAPPSITQRAYAARIGIYDLYERDRWGEQRWVRAFKRSVYYQLKKHGYAEAPRWGETRISGWPAVALEWETGQRVMRAGWPQRRWAIRVRLHDGGSAASRAGRAKSDSWVGTGRQSTVDDHDW